MPSRLIKTEEDIKNIIEAVRIIDDVYDKILSVIREGMSEIEISNLITEYILEEGASGPSFDTIVAFGENGCEPHHVSTDRKLKKGDLVTIDMGAIKNGQCSDFTRTFGYGTISDKQKEIYSIVQKSQKEAAAKLDAGVACDEIDKIARDIIAKAGYGEYYIHGTGHGVGEQIHEAPTLNATSEEILETNEVDTVEPGIYLKGEKNGKGKEFCEKRPIII